MLWYMLSQCFFEDFVKQYAPDTNHECHIQYVWKERENKSPVQVACQTNPSAYHARPKHRIEIDLGVVVGRAFQGQFQSRDEPVFALSLINPDSGFRL